eukprot:6464573-Amphidinium_carterae.3
MFAKSRWAGGWAFDLYSKNSSPCMQELEFLTGTLADAVKSIPQKQSSKWYAVLPDRFAGPDVVVFRVKDAELKEVKVVQSKLYSETLKGNELKHALDTTDLSSTYSRKDGSEIKTRKLERTAITKFAKTHVDKIERILVCSAGVEGETPKVRVVSAESDKDLKFLEQGLWSLIAQPTS